MVAFPKTVVLSFPNWSNLWTLKNVWESVLEAVIGKPPNVWLTIYGANIKTSPTWGTVFGSTNWLLVSISKLVSPFKLLLYKIGEYEDKITAFGYGAAKLWVVAVIIEPLNSPL